MSEKLNTNKAPEQRIENIDIPSLSESELGVELGKVIRRLNVVDDLAEKPEMMNDPIILEERRKLDARKAAIEVRLDQLADPFSHAVGGHGDTGTLKRIESERDQRIGLQ